MLRGLLRLTWLEIKIFVREPLGAIGSVVIPVVVFSGSDARSGRGCRRRRRRPASCSTPRPSSPRS